MPAKKATAKKPDTKPVPKAVAKPKPKPAPKLTPEQEGHSVKRGQPWERSKGRKWLEARFPDDPGDRKLVKIHRVSKPEDASHDQGLQVHGLPYQLRFDKHGNAELPKGDWDEWVEPQRVWFGIELAK